MANEKLQGYLRDLLTLEVTTIVLDEIPDQVTLDLKSHLETMIGKWHEDTHPATRSVDSGPDGTKMRSAPADGPRGQGSGAGAREGASQWTTTYAKLQQLAETAPGESADGEDEGSPVTADAAPAAGGAAPGPGGVRSSDLRLSRRRKGPSRATRALRGARAKMMLDLCSNGPGAEAPLEDLPEKRRLALRRIATLGDSPIAAHTTLSVSGDLVNLISSECATAEGELIRRMHVEGVTNAIGWWNSMAVFVRDTLGSILGLISSTKR